MNTIPKIINPLDELHNKAMELADAGFYANRKGNESEVKRFYQEAFQYEKAAAMLLVNDYKMEPTRSVLFRSAASLILNYPTINAAEFRAAEKMVSFGLTGNPPVEIAEELRQVLIQIKDKYEQTEIKKGKPFVEGGHFIAINLTTKQFEFLSKDEKLIKGSFVDHLAEQLRQITFSLSYTISGWLKQEANNRYGIIDKIQLQ